MASGPRGRTEPYTLYRARLRHEERKLRERLRGRMFWNSKKLGTYRRPRED